jgi:Tfp pilus assembly protein PilO
LSYVHHIFNVITEQEKLTESRKTLCEQESSQADSAENLSHVRKELDSKRDEVEKLTLQLAEMSGNALTSAKSLTSRNESLQKMVINSAIVLFEKIAM